MLFNYHLMLRVKENLPGKDLNKEECERLIAALLVEDVLYPKAVFTPYR